MSYVGAIAYAASLERRFNRLCQGAPTFNELERMSDHNITVMLHIADAFGVDGMQVVEDVRRYL